MSHPFCRPVTLLPRALGDLDDLPSRVLSDTLERMVIGELLRATRERHGLTQARLARRIGSDRAYVSRVEAGEVSPTIDWATRALAAMGEELVLDVQRSRFDDHDPQAHRLVGSWDADRRLEDLLASATALETLTRTEP
jgi:transcriptional regulator with XRE-family HTH domain